MTKTSNKNNNKTYIIQYIHNGNFENILTRTFTEKEVIEHYNKEKNHLIHAEARDMYISSLQTCGQILIRGVKIETPLSPEAAFIKQSLDKGEAKSPEFIEDICLSFICSCLFDINKMPSNIKLAYSDNPLQRQTVTITMLDNETFADYTEEQYLQDSTMTDSELDALAEEAMEEMRMDELAWEKEKAEYIKNLPFKDPSRHGPLESYIQYENNNQL